MHSMYIYLLYTHQWQDPHDAENEIYDFYVHLYILYLNVYSIQTDNESSPSKLLATAKIFGE